MNKGVNMPLSCCCPPPSLICFQQVCFFCFFWYLSGHLAKFIYDCICSRNRLASSANVLQPAKEVNTEDMMLITYFKKY